MTETNLVQLKTISFGNFTPLSIYTCPSSIWGKFNNAIPDTVGELDISANRIPDFPHSLSKLKNLRVLGMSFNDMAKVKV
ncbi:unnamed protein product [Candida parapsilosis]